MTSSNYFREDALKNATVFDNSFLTHSKQLNPADIKKIVGNNQIGVIALNYPVGEKLWPFWQAATLRITDVGGSRQLCEASRKLGQSVSPKDVAPMLIIGNTDKMDKDACGWLQHGTKCVKSVDENQSDLERILHYLLSQTQAKSEIGILMVYGALNQRLDKLLGNLNVVAKFSQHFKRLILFDEQNITELLKPGVYTIKYEGLNKDNTMSCGVFPLAGSANEVATEGLKWDLRGQRLDMGGLVSNCNVIENSTIHIRSSDPVLFTVGCGHCHPEKQHMHGTA